MKPDVLLDAIGLISDEYVSDSLYTKPKKRKGYLKLIAPIAACIAVAIGVVLVLRSHSTAPEAGGEESNGQVLGVGEISLDEKQEVSLEDPAEESTVEIRGESAEESLEAEDNTLPFAEEKLIWSGNLSEYGDNSFSSQEKQVKNLANNVKLYQSFYKEILNAAEDEWIAVCVVATPYWMDDDRYQKQSAEIAALKEESDRLYNSAETLYNQLRTLYREQGMNYEKATAKIMGDPDYIAAYNAAYEACVKARTAWLTAYSEIYADTVQYLADHGFVTICDTSDPEYQPYLFFSGSVGVMAGTKDRFLALEGSESPSRLFLLPAFKYADQLVFGFDCIAKAEPFSSETNITKQLAELYEADPETPITVRVYYGIELPSLEEAEERGWRALGFDNAADFNAALRADLLTVEQVQLYIRTKRTASFGKVEKQAVIDALLLEGEHTVPTDTGYYLVRDYLLGDHFYATLDYDRAKALAADPSIAYIELAQYELVIDLMLSWDTVGMQSLDIVPVIAG